MMGLEISTEWLEADDVLTPELRATWARIEISVNGELATLVRDRRGGLREGIYVAAYPLAEWLALHWWSIVTPPAPTRRARHSLAEAGDGFPWPDLTFTAQRDVFLLAQQPQPDPRERVQFLGSIAAMTERDQTIATLRNFVQDVVDRLHGEGIPDTLLAHEWAAISAMDSDEADFSLLAGALGWDPRNVTDEQTRLILAAGEQVPLVDVLLEVVENSTAEALQEDAAWVGGALQTTAEATSEASPALTNLADAIRKELVPGREFELDRPWEEGFARAGFVRRFHGVDALEPIDPTEFVASVVVPGEPSFGIHALGRVDDGIVLATPRVRSTASRRFSSARLLSRALFSPASGPSLITRSSSLRDRMERAFAAELLAPAEGIRQRLGSRVTEEGIRKVANAYGVDPIVVEHQVQNRHLLSEAG